MFSPNVTFSVKDFNSIHPSILLRLSLLREKVNDSYFDDRSFASRYLAIYEWERGHKGESIVDPREIPISAKILTFSERRSRERLNEPETFLYRNSVGKSR